MNVLRAICLVALFLSMASCLYPANEKDDHIIVDSLSEKISLGEYADVYPHLKPLIFKCIEDSVFFDDYTFIKTLCMSSTIEMAYENYISSYTLLEESISDFDDLLKESEYYYLISLERAKLYYCLKKYDKAKDNLQLALNFIEDRTKQNDIDYAECLLMYAQILSKEKELEPADLYVKKMINFLGSFSTPKGIRLSVLKMKGLLMEAQIRFELENDTISYENTLNRIRNITSKSPNTRFCNIYSEATIILAELVHKKGFPQVALELLSSIDKYNLEYRLMDSYLQNCILVFGSLGRVHDMLNYFNLYDQNIKYKFTKNITTLGIQNGELLYREWYNSLYLMTQIVVNIYGNGDCIAKLYDNLLFTKDAIYEFDKIIKSTVYNAENTELSSLYKAYIDAKEQIIYNADPDIAMGFTHNSDVGLLEKNVLSKIDNFSESLNEEIKDWQIIRNNLEGDEAAIEYIWFCNLEKHQLEYDALIITKDSEYPEKIKVCDKSEFDEMFTENMDEVQINSMYLDNNKSLCSMLWKPIESKVANKRRLYISLSSTLNRINFSAIPIAGGKRLSDIKDVHMVRSTADIKLKERVSYKYKSAIVYGDISYSVDSISFLAEALKYSQHSAKELKMSEITRGKFALLPGTKDEQKSIIGILGNREINTKGYSEKGANEESFKKLSGNAPDILHLATHGFNISSQLEKDYSFARFLIGTTNDEYYMILSGLLFAGAERVWNGKQRIDGIEDGILTAEEISRMNLRNTKLVVLSACGSGLGGLDAYEGVLGLQKAFKMAGVETIVMSLWDVPDEATSKLMTLFYSNLLNGETVVNSLKKAQKEMQKIYSDPYYWAAFIVLE